VRSAAIGASVRSFFISDLLFRSETLVALYPGQGGLNPRQLLSPDAGQARPESLSSATAWAGESSTRP